MKMKFIKQGLVIITVVVSMSVFLASALLSVRAEAAEQQLKDRAAQYQKDEYANNGVINSDMGVGSYAFYILKQAGIDTGSWMHGDVSLDDMVTGAVQNDIANAGQISAKLLAQDLAAAQALGREDLAAQLLQLLKNRQGRWGFDERGALSVYSNVPAYELLSRTGLLGQLDTALARNYILGAQYTGAEEKYFGSWGSTDNGNFYADFIAATGALRMLNRMDPGGADPEIQAAVRNGLAWIKNQQKAGGNYVAGMDDTLIDTCDVIVTLRELGMEPADWVSSEGKSAVDYLVSEALNTDGSFGQSGNVMDAAWVLWACLALEEKGAGAEQQAQPVQQPPAVQEPQPAEQEPPDTQAQPAMIVFTDVKSHWAENAIYHLAGMGITAGYADGTFKPEEQVTRYEIAAMMVRLLQSAPAAAGDTQSVRERFADAGDIPGWALEAAAVALREGLISGSPRPDGTFSFDGSRQVSRAELAVMMARVIENKLGQAAPKALDFADRELIPGWAGNAVGIVYIRGIAGGYPDGTFRAENSVTRAEAASMISRLADQVERK
jgi:hypothetical protein